MHASNSSRACQCLSLFVCTSGDGTFGEFMITIEQSGSGIGIWIRAEVKLVVQNWWQAHSIEIICSCVSRWCYWCIAGLFATSILHPNQDATVIFLNRWSSNSKLTKPTPPESLRNALVSVDARILISRRMGRRNQTPDLELLCFSQFPQIWVLNCYGVYPPRGGGVPAGLRELSEFEGPT